MRELHVSKIEEAVAALCDRGSFELPDDTAEAIRVAARTEPSPAGREVLTLLDENQRLARGERIPICQDTGFALVFVELGQDLHLVGGDLDAAIQRGISRGYTDNYLRASMVAEPLFERVNTRDNTPAMITVDIVPGDRIRLAFLAKGAGSENSTQLGMLTPAAGPAGVRDFVVQSVVKAGPNACPPVVVGVGIGGTADRALLLAKKATLRSVGSANAEPRLAAFEREILAAINATGVGPQGYGGRTTALSVQVMTAPTHIASLPVAVNLQCHAVRHAEVVL
jgi:fumarate hydratase subunit alpha